MTMQKNYSVITSPEKTPHLSPLYDLVSTTAHKSLTKKMAVKLGTEYKIEKIKRMGAIYMART